MTIRLGVPFTPSMPPEQLRSLATSADAAGLDDLWLWEDSFEHGALASAGSALAWTERLRVGIGLMPAPYRNVALTAMELGTLQRLFPGRVVGGVGHGVQSWMEQAGARVSSPMTLLEEYLPVLRRLLHGETVTESGRYVQLDQVGLHWPPQEAPPLMTGGFGPKTVQLAGRLGDGVLLPGPWTRQQIGEACEIARTSRARAGLDPDHLPIVATVLIAAGRNARERMDATVASVMGSPDSDLGIAGSADQIAEAFDELRKLGVTAISALPADDEPDVDELVHILGTEVRPLLS